MPNSVFKLILKAQDKGASATMKRTAKAAELVGAAVGTIGLAKLAADMVRTTAEFQKLNASLVTVTGSQETANAAFAELNEFAKTTPFQLQEVVTAFTKMKALGLDPSIEAMTSFGNTSSAMGKSLDQMVEAVADAATGEFERLKDFGIKAKSQGEQVEFTFAGVSTTVQKEAGAIQTYLQRLGNEQFAGGMLRQMDTIGGAFSNLQGAYANLLAEMGSGETGQTLIDAMNTLSAQLSDPAFVDAMANFASGAAQLASLGLDFFKGLSDEVSTTAQWAAARSTGEIGFWEWAFTGEEDAAKRLEELAGGGNLQARVESLRKEVFSRERVKRSDIHWSRFEEEEFQALKARLSSAEAAWQDELILGAANMPPAPASTASAVNDPAGGSGTEGESQGFSEYEIMLADRAVADEEYRINKEAADLAAEEQRMIAFSEYQDMLTERELAGVNARIAAAEMEKQKKLLAMQTGMSALGNLASLSNTNSRKMFEVSKVAAIAETTINTYKSATSAYSALAHIPVVGPALGAAAAAAAIAAGTANVQKIQSQSFGKGGGATATYAAEGGSGIGFGTTPVRQPVQETPAEQKDLTIKVVGVMSDVFVEEKMVPALNQAGSRNVKIEYVPEGV